MKSIFALAMLVGAALSAAAEETCCRDGKLLLKADNEKYLCRVTKVFDDDEGDGETYTAQTIQASKSTPDESCRFTVNNQPDGTVTLRADNGKYLHRMDHEQGFYPVEAHKSTLDQSCYFKVHNQPDGTVALQTDNGFYLRRVDCGEFVNYIFAKEGQIDEFCKFSFVQE